MEMKKDVLASKKRNFSVSEKQHLFSLIEPLKHIIENKKTNGATNEEKNRAWDMIAFKFNSISPDSIHRTAASLKKLFYNSKRDVKKSLAEERMQRIATGGGPSREESNDPNQDLLLSLVNEKSFIGMTARHDSDMITCPPNNLTVELELNEDMVDEDDIYEVNKGHNDLEITQAKKFKQNDSNPLFTNTIKLLQTPKNPGLRTSSETSKRRPTTVVKALTSSVIAEKYELLVDHRLVIANLEQKNLESQIEEREYKRQSLMLDIEVKKEELEKKKLENKMLLMEYELKEVETKLKKELIYKKYNKE